MITIEPGTADTFPNCILNGKRIAYTNESVFKVQVGFDRGSYKTRYTFIGDLHRAVTWYAGINIGKGYKKRLICDTFNHAVILRDISSKY